MEPGHKQSCLLWNAGILSGVFTAVPSGCSDATLVYHCEAIQERDLLSPVDVVAAVLVKGFLFLDTKKEGLCDCPELVWLCLQVYRENSNTSTFIVVHS